jgi:hypothetical protein
MKRDKFINHYTEYLSKKQKDKFIFRLQSVIHEEVELYKERQRFITNFLNEHEQPESPLGVWDKILDEMERNPDYLKARVGKFVLNGMPTSMAAVLNKQNPNE